MRVVITKDTSSGKKMRAIFYDGEKKVRTVRFGAARDYTEINKKSSQFYLPNKEDREKVKKAYKSRHAGDNLTDKFSPGALSMFVLWSSKSLSQGIKNYKSRFNLK